MVVVVVQLLVLVVVVVVVDVVTLEGNVVALAVETVETLALPDAVADEADEADVDAEDDIDIAGDLLRSTIDLDNMFALARPAAAEYGGI